MVNADGGTKRRARHACATSCGYSELFARSEPAALVTLGICMIGSTFNARQAGAALMLVAGFASAAIAQSAAPAATAIPPPPVETPAPTTTAVAGPAAKAAAAANKGRECTRLPLSDIQVGKDKTIEVARLRLDEYIAKVGKQKGWKSWDKSLETVSCEDYLFVPLLGQEYKCMVTATFCKKS